MVTAKEIESAQILKEQIELREQAQKAEAFIAANIIILESKLALEDTPEFVAVRPENFWDDNSFREVEFEKDTYYFKNCRFLVARKPNWLTITTNPRFSDRNQVQRELQVKGDFSHTFISILTSEVGFNGPRGPHSNNGVGWAFLNARLLLTAWFGKTDPSEIMRPFMKEEDLSLANILAKTQVRIINPNASR